MGWEVKENCFPIKKVLMAFQTKAIRRGMPIRGSSLSTAIIIINRDLNYREKP